MNSIPLGRWIEGGIDFLTINFAGATRAFSGFVDILISYMIDFLEFLPFWVIILLVGFLSWKVISLKGGILSILGLLLIWSFGLWEPTVSTFALVVASTFIAIVLGLPLGIIAALNDRFYRLITPVLDFMQTMPAFVYLIPAIPFFGLGKVAAVFATVIFSIPPSIRFTALGIRQLPEDLIEAADAFGSTTMQKLLKVQLPLAAPTILGGINQTIMLALSMVVIAAMIGAGGLGGVVWRAIQRLEMGMGFEAGIAIVILAMIFDRLTQNIVGKK